MEYTHEQLVNLSFNDFIKYQAYLDRLLTIKYTNYYRKVYQDNNNQEYLNRCEFEMHNNKVYIEDDIGSYIVSQNEVTFHTHEAPLTIFKLSGSLDNYQIEYPDKMEHRFNFNVHYREKEPVNPIMLSFALFFWSRYEVPTIDIVDNDDIVKPVDGLSDNIKSIMSNMVNYYQKDIEASDNYVLNYNKDMRNKESERQKEERNKQEKLDQMLEKSTQSKSNMSNQIKNTKKSFDLFKEKVRLNNEINTLSFKIIILQTRKEVLTEESNLDPTDLKTKVETIDEQLEELHVNKNNLITEFESIQSELKLIVNDNHI